MALPEDLREALVGAWAGDYTLWLQPDVVAQECPVTATFARLLDDRFLVHTYEWSYEGTPQHGHAILGRVDDGTFQMAWTDTWHNGDAIMFCTGGPQPSVTGTYADSDPAGPWRWRTEFAVVDAAHVVVTAYNITPQGDEMKATEARYAKR